MTSGPGMARSRKPSPAGPAPAVLLALLAAGAAGCHDAPAERWPAPLVEPLLVSGPSPYPAGCNPPAAGATLFLGAEVEPHLVLDAEDPSHLVAAWQQDRWLGGGANGLGVAASFDGGRTWTRSQAPFTVCSGGTLAGGAYLRASDPWLALAPGAATVHQLALAFDNPGTDPSTARSAILASRSTDGGLTWGAPRTLATTADPDLTLDKCTLTADPIRPGHLYAVWDRLAGLTGPPALATGPAYLARSTDDGLSWEAPAVLHDPGPDAQTISSQIVVAPDGTLVNLLILILQSSQVAPLVEVAVLRSADAGLTWGAPITVADWRSVGVVDPAGGRVVRGGDIVPGIAVDRASGHLYVVWQDGRFSGGVRDGIALSRSLNGGVTWSAPVRVNGDGGAPAFTAAVAVAGSGRVGVGYYDLRPDAAWDAALWPATRWLATSDDGGATFTEAPVGGPFDLRRAPQVPGYFLGDYVGLVGGDATFTSLFAMTRAGAGPEGTDLFAWPPQP